MSWSVCLSVWCTHLADLAQSRCPDASTLISVDVSKTSSTNLSTIFKVFSNANVPWVLSLLYKLGYRSCEQVVTIDQWVVIISVEYVRSCSSVPSLWSERVQRLPAVPTVPLRHCATVLALRNWMRAHLPVCLAKCIGLIARCIAFITLTLRQGRVV